MEYLKIEKAEKITGIRLDRRRKYFLFEGGVCFATRCIITCSGCFNGGGENSHLDDGYKWDDINKIRLGAGCDECGYHGKIVDYFPVPHNFNVKSRA